MEDDDGDTFSNGFTDAERHEAVFPTPDQQQRSLQAMQQGGSGGGLRAQSHSEAHPPQGLYCRGTTGRAGNQREQFPILRNAVEIRPL